MSESEVERLSRRIEQLERENAELEAAVLADRAAQQEAVAALQATEQRLRRAQEAGRVGVFTIDLVNNTMHGTPELCRIFGLPVTDSMPADVIEKLVVPQDSNAVSHAEDRRLGRTKLETQYRIRRADDGQERCIARWAEYEMDSQGRPVKLIGVLQDITERWVAEREIARGAAELKRLNEHLEKEVAARTADRNRLWELSTDIMLVTGGDGSVASVNPAWTATLGWQQDELLGSSGFDLVHRDDIPVVEAAAMALGRGEPVPSLECRFRHKDGSYRWISWGAVAGEGFVIAVGRDVTAQREQARALRQAEEALRQSQKMEAVGHLTGGLAHDFNNLLVGITASLELLQLRVKQGRVAELDRYVHAAQSSAGRAASLTHRLLAFSRRQTLDPKPTDVNRLVVGMEDLVRRTVGPTIETRVVTDPALWTALVDAHQLENTLLNLCINARDAMPGGGRLVVETGNRHLDEAAAHAMELTPGAYLSLSVSDTGTGMAPEVMQRAFEPFFTTKPIGMGTGLGLSMVYGFARQSGGQVRVRSEPGQGTTMTIYLPRHLGSATSEEHPACVGVEKAVSGMTALVIDDEATVREVVVEVLRDLGFHTLQAADGPGGMAILTSDVRIDLLVSDVGLPGGMNGRQVADAARTLRPGLKVIFITGYAENAAVGKGVLEPGMQVVTKPFSIDVLAARVRDFVKEPLQ